MTLVYYFFGLVPIAVFLRARKVGTVVAVQVLEDSVLIFETTV